MVGKMGGPKRRLIEPALNSSATNKNPEQFPDTARIGYHNQILA